MHMKAVGFVVAIALVSGCASAPVSESPTPLSQAPDAVVKVLYHLQYSEGESPGGTYGGRWRADWRSNNASQALAEERALEMPGWLVGEDSVITQDLALEDRFIAGIEVETSAGRHPARFERFALDYPVCFLKTARPVEGATALSFTEADEGPLFVTTCEIRDGQLAVVSSAFEKVSLPEDREEGLGHTSAIGPIVTASGAAVSFAASHGWWSREEASASPLEWRTIKADDLAAAVEAVRAKAAAGILAVTTRLRSWGTRRFDIYMDYYEDQRTPTEFQAPGLYVGNDLVLVLTDLSRRDTGRIESMTVEVNGRTIPLEVKGAFSRYAILVTSPAEPLDGAAVLSPAAFNGEEDIDMLLVADRLTFENFARDEKFARERYGEVGLGFQDLLWPMTLGGGQDDFLFTCEGDLAAVPIAVRRPLSMGDQWMYEDPSRRALTMPADRLAAMAADIKAHVDRDFKMLEEDEARRLVWLGLETQPLDDNLARATGASLATKGGEIGAMVSHVHAGSPAEKADIRTGDILLRFSAPQQLLPINITVQERRAPRFPWAELDQIADIYYEQLPRPWPSRENELTRLLTEVGAGRTIVLSFVRDGVEMSASITLETAPKDFTSADKYESEPLGLAVKDITYEVRGFFQMAQDAPGVVVADVKPGSKASVAGLKPCELITAVNASPVKNVEEFEKALSAGGKISLTVQRMFESRVIQVSLETSGARSAAPEEPALSGPEEAAPAAEEAPAPTEESESQEAPAAEETVESE